ncbi:20645_t:CDS:1, partial [Gigaspora rosea]
MCLSTTGSSKYTAPLLPLSMKFDGCRTQNFALFCNTTLVELMNKAGGDCEG